MSKRTCLENGFTPLRICEVTKEIGRCRSCLGPRPIIGNQEFSMVVFALWFDASIVAAPSDQMHLSMPFSAWLTTVNRRSYRHDNSLLALIHVR